MVQVAPQTFDVIGREISGALNDARIALEAFVEQPENISLLDRSADELHRIQGVLRLLEIYGAALLAEEMEHVTRYLIATSGERKNQSESLDALLRAMVQLPSYLDRVLAGGRDLALVLLPLLNDLRAVRGSPLLSEGTLLLLNLRSDVTATPKPPPPGEPTLTVAQWARRVRAQYQLGLVGWIRGERVGENLATLAQVAHRIEEVATQQPVFQLWWITGAVIEALREAGLEDSVTIKRLLGLADRELRRLYEEGEPRYCQTPPVELVNNLLYYVARATTNGPRVAAVRVSFRLDELLPVDQDIDEERESLSAPSIKLMQTVAAAIREDLGKVKDTLDIFVRRGSGQPAELAPQIELLRKIGDTLGVLGLGELRGNIQKELGRLEDVVSGRVGAVDPALIEIATTLIQVEDRLDSSLLRMIVPSRSETGGLVGGADGVARDASGEPASEDFLSVQSAVLRECIVNLARIKEAIAQNVGGNLDAGGLDAWPDLVRGIKAGLLLLGRTRAVAIVEEIAGCLRRVMQPSSAGHAASYLDRLADAIVSVEYYMETLQAGRAEPHYMLDNAQTCLDTIVATPMTAAPTVAAIPDSALARTLNLNAGADAAAATLLLPGGTTVPSMAQGDAGATSRQLRALAAAEQAQQPRAAPPVLTAAPAGALPAEAGRKAREQAQPLEEVDPEIREVFVEEAREEVVRIGRYFPEWDRNPADIESLRTVRRSFHTLKGSGRMVGARELPEFAWSIENLLNRVLDGTLERTPAVAAILREAVEVAPALVEHLAGGPEVDHDVPGLVGRAHALAVGQAPATAVTAGPAIGSAAAPGAPAETLLSPAAESLEPPTLLALSPNASTLRDNARDNPRDNPRDNQLREIYERETDTHVATVRGFIDREQLRREPHRVSEEVYRACHTLSGSSQMAEARHGTRLAEPINRWLRKAWHSTAGLRDGDLALLRDCMDAMQQVARFPDETTQFFVSHDLLRARLVAAEAELDRRISEDASAPRPPLPQFAAPIPAPAALPAAPEIENQSDADAADRFDPEVAAIFMDEATELLEASELALQNWRGARSDSAALVELKRPLHTLKGGARMAGVRAMGDLSHELETTIGHIELGLVPGDERAESALQRSLDRLAIMRDALARGERPAPADELVAELHRLSGTAFALAEETAAAEEAAAAADDAATAAARARDAESFEPTADHYIEAGVEVDATGTVERIDLPSSLDEEAGPAVRDAAASRLSFEPDQDDEDDDIAAGFALPSGIAVPPGREPAPATGERQEMARVDADLLDQLLNNAGEVSIGRARLEQQVAAIGHNLGELSRTVTRLKEQLRKLEIETEKQILHRYESEGTHRGDFDPLELDRYSSIQQFSRALAETASDVGSIQQLLETLTQDTESLLQQQARVVTELQNGLMRTRMVPFQRHAQRLSRIVRQAASDEGKRAELVIEGASGELDRQVLERMLGPFEHILRNAVVHGIEAPAERVARGKNESGRITMALRREGAEVVVEVSDDGAGFDLVAIRGKARELGLLRDGREPSDSEAVQLILEPGFSTAGRLTQHAGRGVGMDVVATEVKKLGGALNMESLPGEGARFVVRLPFTLAISHALVVRVEDELYALPLPTVEGVVRLPRDEVMRHLAADSPTYEYSGQSYRLQPLAVFVGLAPTPPPAQDVTVPVVLVRSGDHSTGLVTDELVGSREIVVKSVGPQIAAIRGVSGATVLGDGRVVIILDIAALLRADWRSRVAPVAAREKTDSQPIALVVDDSITVRRVTQRLLERNGIRVFTARDGLDAVTMLAEHLPDVILLDIEMPRMDGYEVAAHVRGDPRTRDIPIIMITSRVGDKHRARAIELGVDDYLGKPYQEAQLLEAIEPLIARRRGELTNG